MAWTQGGGGGGGEGAVRGRCRSLSSSPSPRRREPNGRRGSQRQVPSASAVASEPPAPLACWRRLWAPRPAPGPRVGSQRHGHPRTTAAAPVLPGAWRARLRLPPAWREGPSRAVHPARGARFPGGGGRAARWRPPGRGQRRQRGGRNAPPGGCLRPVPARRAPSPGARPWRYQGPPGRRCLRPGLSSLLPARRGSHQGLRAPIPARGSGGQSYGGSGRRPPS